MKGRNIVLTTVSSMPDSVLRKASRQHTSDHISLKGYFLSNKIHLEKAIKNSKGVI